MKTCQMLLVGTLACSAAFVFAQTLPSTFPKQPQRFYSASASAPGEIRVFHLGGKQYRAKITQPEAMLGPDWTPSQPLPLSLAKAEEIARAELHKLVADSSNWKVTHIQLGQVRARKWYYSVRLAPSLEPKRTGSDSFFAFINLAGEPGLVELESLADVKRQK